MISKAIYYHTFIPKYNVLNNGIDFTRTLQSINRDEIGFNLIISSNKNIFLGHLISYLFTDKKNRITSGIYNGELISNNQNLFNIQNNYQIIIADLNKIAYLLKNNRINRFILDIEYILDKSNYHNSFIKYKLGDIKHIIRNTNIENINICSSQIVLKLLSLITYIKLLHEYTLDRNNLKVLSSLNKLISPIIQNVTNHVTFRSLKYKSVNKIYTKILKFNDYLRFNICKFKFNAQICFADYLYNIYLLNFVKSIKSILSFLINIIMYVLSHLLIIIFMLISTIIKISIDLIVYIFD